MIDGPPLPTLPSDHQARLERARLSLDGLSVGDAFGQRFFYPPSVESLIAERALPQPPWHYTDDTEMALAIVETLDRHGHIDQDALAVAFARRYRANPARGYGGMAHQILMSIGAGEPWSDAAGRVFGGAGSLGNGGAMRAAPIGAYWADDYDRVVHEARAAAEVTHAHAEGQAGAIAVAVAAARAARHGNGARTVAATELLEVALAHTPPGETRAGLERAAALPLDRSVSSAASLLGSGYRATSPDTVPFTLWCAARHIGNYEDALWATVAGLGDRDTTCAIVGGIVVLATGKWSIPEEWLDAREPLEYCVGT